MIALAWDTAYRYWAIASAFARLLRWLAPIETREMPAVVAAFSLFFFMWAGYFAVRHVLGQRGEHDLGLRIEHFSNAGIRDPNPGMDFASLRYTHRF